MAELDDPVKLTRKETRIKMIAQQEKSDLGHVLSSSEGRRFVHWLLDISGYRRTSFHGEQTHQMAFYEGQRNIGNQIQARIENDFVEEMLLMMQEAKTEEQNRK